MEIEFILERVHQRGFGSARAFQIVFTNSQIFFIHLGDDSAALPLGKAMGGLAGAVAQSIAEKIDNKTIDRRLEEIQSGNLDEVVAKDKRSFRASYSDLEGFESGPFKWNQWPHVTFKIRGKGSFKFAFDLNMFDQQQERLEEERNAVVDFMRGKCPILCKAVS